MNTEKTPTIGDQINNLVAQFGNSTIGLYILERALQKACEASQPSDTVKIGNLLVCETPGYIKRRAEYEAIIAEIKAEQSIA